MSFCLTTLVGCAILSRVQTVHKSIVCDYGVWLSLVEHTVRDREVAGSNPVTPTRYLQALEWAVAASGNPIAAYRIERGRGYPAASFRYGLISSAFEFLS